MNNHCCMWLGPQEDSCIPHGSAFFCRGISHWTNENINKWQQNLYWKWQINIHIYSQDSGLRFLRSGTLWELLLMWFQQTPKMSQGELLAYIFRERWRGRGRRWKIGHRKKKATETEIAWKIQWVLYVTVCTILCEFCICHLWTSPSRTGIFLLSCYQVLT